MSNNLGKLCGVLTDNSGRVVELKLKRQGLEGEIPAQLGLLSKLTVLDLSENGISGKIPEELGDLKNLSRLDLSENKLGGGTDNVDDMSWLVKLESLTRLDLSHNRRGTTALFTNSGLKGKFPLELASNEKLTHINISNNLFNNDLDQLLSAFSSRGDGSSFDLNIRDNTWDTRNTPAASKGMVDWAGELLIEGRDFESEDWDYLMSLMSTATKIRDDMKLTVNVLQGTRKGETTTKDVYKVAKMTCGYIDDCNAIMDEIQKEIDELYQHFHIDDAIALKDALKELWDSIPRSLRGVTILYYDITIFSNPMVEDLMESIVLGWLNGWTNDETLDYFLASVPYFKDRSFVFFELKHYRICEEPAQRPRKDTKAGAWCNICQPAYDYAAGLDEDADVKKQYSLMRWCDKNNP